MILFKRSVMMESRRIMPYVIRLALLSLLAYGVYIGARPFYQRMVVGKMIFSHLSFINIFAVFIIGAFFFSSAISEEREEDMLGLIKMTGISRLNLLASKFFSNFLSGIMLLVVQIPIVLLCITLGGVALQQIVVVYSVLLIVLFFVCSVGLMSSVFARNTRSSIGLSVFLISSYCLLPILIFLFRSLFRLSSIDCYSIDKCISLFPSYFNLFSRSRLLPSETNILLPLYVMGTFGVIALLLSYLLYDKCTARNISAWEWLKLHLPKIRRAGGEREKMHSRRRVWTHFPFAWKSYHMIGGGGIGVFIRLIYYDIIFMIVYYLEKGKRDIAFTMFCCFLILLLLEVFSLYTRVLSYEKREHAIAILEIIPGSRFRKLAQLLGGVFFHVILGIIITTVAFYYHYISFVYHPNRFPIEYVSFVLLFIYASVSALYASMIMRYGATVGAGIVILMQFFLFLYTLRGVSIAVAAFFTVIFFVSTFSYLLTRRKFKQPALLYSLLVGVASIGVFLFIKITAMGRHDRTAYFIIIIHLIALIAIVFLLIYRKFGELSQE